MSLTRDPNQLNVGWRKDPRRAWLNSIDTKKKYKLEWLTTPRNQYHTRREWREWEKGIDKKIAEIRV